MNHAYFNNIKRVEKCSLTHPICFNNITSHNLYPCLTTINLHSRSTTFFPFINLLVYQFTRFFTFSSSIYSYFYFFFVNLLVFFLRQFTRFFSLLIYSFFYFFFVNLLVFYFFLLHLLIMSGNFNPNALKRPRTRSTTANERAAEAGGAEQSGMERIFIVLLNSIKIHYLLTGTNQC
jgi:hypothetical protein